MQQAINGGRVQFSKPSTDFTNAAVGPISDPLYTVRKTFTPTPFICAFFSKKNMNTLQVALQREILRLSKGKYRIGKQSETDLVVVMRSVFCMFGKNLCGCNVQNQVDQLNAEVLQMIVPTVYTRILNYMGYKRDAEKSLESDNRVYDFMDRGISTSGPSRKVLSYPMM